MNLVYSIIFFISAIFVIIYDYKYQKIPLYIIIINFVSLCLLTNILCLIGIIFIFILKKLDKPIDVVYLVIIGYLIITIGSIWSILSIIVLLTFVLMSQKDNISFMIPIEISCLIELIIKGGFITWLVQY